MAKKSVVVTVLFVGLVSIWMGGCQTPEQKVERLIKKLGHKKAKVRANATEALSNIGEDAVPALIQALQDQDEWVRSRATLALGRIGGGAEDAVPALMQTLQDKDVYVRKYAASALGSIGEGAIDAVPALIQVLQDQDIRINAAFALGKIGTPEALKAVEEYQPQQ